MPKPNFFIVGAPRCGTTAMYEYLRQHPDIYMPYRKEPVYFGSDLQKRPPYLDEQHYLALFNGARHESRIGEATVWYLYSQTAPSEIKAFSPRARVIVMLRNPVQMVHSLHSHFLFTGNEDIRDLAEAIDAESDRRAGRRLPQGVTRPEGLQYRWLGRFAPHLRRYFAVFGREQIHVIIYDDLIADVEAAYRGTLEFLGVESRFRPAFALVNQNKRARSEALQRLVNSVAARLADRVPPRAFHLGVRAIKRMNMRPEARAALPSALRQRLADEFAADIEELSQLLGRDLRQWYEPVRTHETT